MINAGFILYYLTPRAFALAVGMDIVNSVLLPIGNGKENDEIVKAIKKLWWRYLPVCLLTIVSLAHMIFHLNIQMVQAIIFFLEAWALIYSWNVLGFNINALGGCLNMLVVLANKGLMPVIFSPQLDGRHTLMTDTTKFSFLCDWIIVNNWTISIGDIFIGVGSLIFLVHQFYIFVKILLDRTAKPAVK